MKSFALVVAVLAAFSAFAQPASMDELAIPSQGYRMNGLVYLAAGASPHPVVVFLHGYPGNEKNLDLAQAVRRAGFDAVYFDYRGMWGSGGTFSFAHGLEDAQTVLGWVRANASKYHFDTRRIAIVGHSFGGWVALLTAPHEPPSTCVVAMAAWNIGWAGRRFSQHPDEQKSNLDYFRFTTELGAPVHALATDILREMASHAEWDYLKMAQPLARHPLLLVAAKHDSPDEDIPMHENLERAVRAAGGRVSLIQYDDDHPFSAHRLELANALVHWLQTDCAIAQQSSSR
jgi:pimeloyl-ACP methyl ester carboxylesterase